MIYFDNASTSQIKCSRIPKAIEDYLQNIISSPGRGTHRQGTKASELVDHAKQLLCTIFNGDLPEQFHFCFNATHGLNLVIQGLLEKNDHVVTTALEHNSVLRPLRKMSDERGVEVTIVPCSSDGRMDTQKIIDAIRPTTKLVVLNHASNVFGTILDLSVVLKYCAELGIKTLVDASQTAGIIEIDLKHLPVSFLVATGHKALHGPSGTGFIFARSIDSLNSVLVGGTGGNSASLWHPQNQSTIFEAGTPNYLGIAGLMAALEERVEIKSNLNNPDSNSPNQICEFIFNELRKNNAIKLFGPTSGWDQRVPLFSFNFLNMSPQQALHILDERYGIILRGGLHCAPIAHLMAGTLPTGTLRVSLGSGNTFNEAYLFLEAIREMSNDLNLSPLVKAI